MCFHCSFRDQVHNSVNWIISTENKGTSMGRIHSPIEDTFIFALLWNLHSRFIHTLNNLEVFSDTVLTFLLTWAFLIHFINSIELAFSKIRRWNECFPGLSTFTRITSRKRYLVSLFILTILKALCLFIPTFHRLEESFIRYLIPPVHLGAHWVEKHTLSHSTVEILFSAQSQNIRLHAEKWFKMEWWPSKSVSLSSQEFKPSQNEYR